MKAKWSHFWGGNGAETQRPTLRRDHGVGRCPHGSVRIERDGDGYGFAPHRIARIGRGLLSEERGIFSSLSTEENLLLPPRSRARRPCSPKRFTLFFRSCASPARQSGRALSVGWGTQMLAVARHSCGHRLNGLLLLDEISEGLAQPVIVQQAGRGTIRTLRAQRGCFTVVLAGRTSGRSRSSGRPVLCLESAGASSSNDPSSIHKWDLLHEYLGRFESA